MLKKMLFSLLFVAFSAVCLNAHQVVVKNVEGNKFEVKFWAHTGFDTYKPEQVLGVEAFDENLDPIKTGINYKVEEGKTPEILTDKAPAVITSIFDAQYWINTDNGYEVGDKTKVDGIVFDSLKSMKIGKSFYSWNEKMLKPVGLKIEVIPLANPFKLKVGDSLPVLVLKDGKAYANAGFETAKDELDVTTNEFGIAFIPIKEKGLNIIAARSKEQLLGDPKAQTLLIESSIDFELK